MNRRQLLCSSVAAAVCSTIARDAIARAQQPNARSVEKPASTIPGDAGISSLRINARDHGAIGDGTTLNTAMLQEALDRCNVLGGGEVVIPAGRYLTGSLSLRSNVTLRLEKDALLLGSDDFTHYRKGQVRWEGKWIPGYLGLIHAIDAENIAIVGDGRIEGNIAVAGRPSKDNPLRRPALIEPIGCDGVHLEGFSTLYAHMWSIHPTYCDNVVIKNLTVRSTETNGDGIDIDSSRHVLIDGCDIATGDDCISLKSGRGEEGYRLNRPTENVRITNCTFEGRGYSCIGIGSEASAGIRDIVVEHCKVRSVYKNAFYIKSRIGRGSSIENLTFRDIDAASMRMGFLSINQVSAGIQDKCPVPGIDGVPLFRNFRFQDIRVQDAPVLVNASAIYARKKLDGLWLENISGTCEKGIVIANATNVKLRKISITGNVGPLVSVANVSGQGLHGAATIDPPRESALVPGPSIYTLR
jgi:polygalacturonase